MLILFISNFDPQKGQYFIATLPLIEKFGRSIKLFLSLNLFINKYSLFFSIELKINLKLGSSYKISKPFSGLLILLIIESQHLLISFIFLCIYLIRMK
ncbi:hypothetical protein SAMN05444377_1071 [Flavobacterium fontis]|uniref:Uncharacterized protein n=1 Tax=Flavobacterium fontis TaxID=1124188 RepID=A0A1M5AVH0_9FLAO|nr:hypothetical protein SAMN05444377_1071 [Flavobacterium fontis]